MNMSGKRPWTASLDPVRSPAKSPIAPKAAAIESESAKITGTPSGPAAMVAPAASPAARKATAWSAPIKSTPVSWPARSDGPLIGVSERRLKKPLPMSWAMLVPAVFMAKIAPCMNGKASAKAR